MNFVKTKKDSYPILSRSTRLLKIHAKDSYKHRVRPYVSDPKCEFDAECFSYSLQIRSVPYRCRCLVSYPIDHRAMSTAHSANVPIMRRSGHSVLRALNSVLAIERRNRPRTPLWGHLGFNFACICRFGYTEGVRHRQSERMN